MELYRPATDATAMTLNKLETPCLVLDADRMDRNIARLRGRLASFDVVLSVYGSIFAPRVKASNTPNLPSRIVSGPVNPFFAKRAASTPLSEARPI